MFNWNPRLHWDIWHYELQLQEFPMHSLPIEQQYIAPGEARHEAPGTRPSFEDNVEVPHSKFVFRCYFVAIIFIAISIVQWIVLTTFLSRKVLLVPGFIGLALAFLSLLVMTFCHKLMCYIWCQWLFALILIESMVFAEVLLLRRTELTILLAIVAATLVLVIGYGLGAFLPLILLPGDVTVVLSLMAFTIIGTILLLTLIITEQPIYHTLFAILMCHITIIMILYHAQIIHKRRSSVSADEFLICSTLIYVNFVLFFESIYYLIAMKPA